MYNIVLIDNILMFMFFLIVSGLFGIVIKFVYGFNGVYGIKIVNKIDVKDDEVV